MLDYVFAVTTLKLGEVKKKFYFSVILHVHHELAKDSSCIVLTQEVSKITGDGWKEEDIGP